MTYSQKMYNDDFLSLYENLSVEDNKENNIEGLIMNLFYRSTPPLESKFDNHIDEMIIVKQYLNLYRDDNHRFFIAFRSLHSLHGWDNYDLENLYSEEEVDYLYLRDSRVTIILFMFSCFAFIRTNITGTLSPVHWYKRMVSILAQPEFDTKFLSKKDLYMFKQCLFDNFDVKTTLSDRDKKLVEYLSSRKC